MKRVLDEVRLRVTSRLGEADDAFDRTIGDLTRFRDFLLGLANKYSNASENIKAFAGAVEEIVEYVGKVRQWYREKAYPEVMKLINEGVIRGGKVSLSIVGDYATIFYSKVSTKILIKGIGGLNIEGPPLISKLARKLLGIGLMRTDGYVQRGHPAMTTAFLWQMLLWLMIYPGKQYVYLKGINVSKKGMRFVWHLVAYDGEKLDQVNQVNNVDDLAVMLFAGVLGDGSANPPSGNKKARIELVGADEEEMNMWEDILKALGLKYYRRNRRLITLEVSGENAAKLSKTALNVIATKDPLLFDVMMFLASFHDGEKLRHMFFMKRRGRYSVELLGKAFTVDVVRSFSLRCNVASEEVKQIVNALKNKYGNITVYTHTYTRRRDGYTYVSIEVPRHSLTRMVMLDNDLRRSITAILCLRYRDAEDEKTRQRILKYLSEITPTKETAAMD